MRFICGAGCLVMMMAAVICAVAAEPAPQQPKPKVAVFPMGGTASDMLREHTNFALRTKLDRDGTYEPIAGVVMQDMVEDLKDPVNFDTSPDVLKDLASSESPAILIWGYLMAGDGQGTLRLKILDLRQKDAKPVEFIKQIPEEADFRLAYEEALKKIAGVKDFQHPSEEDVHHDASTDAAWAKNPNLVVDGDFSTEGHWQGVYMERIWPAKIGDDLPGTDDVVIYRDSSDGKPHNVLAMKLSEADATDYGLAAWSDLFKIEPGVKYRISFRFKSDGPNQQSFVKGYTMAKDIAGKPELREIWRRQISPTHDTHGKWVTIESDMNPQHVTFPVQFLKVNFYANLHAGTVMFSDVQLKAVGKQGEADQMHDEAIKPPLDLQAQTRPSP